MIQVKTTEGKVFELADSFSVAIAKWNLQLDYQCNQSASQQRPIIDELKNEEETFVLRGSLERYFLEHYKGKTMYPSVYKVRYTPQIEWTNEDLEREFQKKYGK